MQMPRVGQRPLPDFGDHIRYQQLHRYGVAFGMARDLDVLDIASGEGYGSAYLAIVARSVLGVDLDRYAVRHAAARYTSMNLAFRTGSFARFPADDESFDLVVSFDTLDTPDEREQFMREIVRVLRPSGSLIVSVPNKLLESDRNGADDGVAVRAMFFDEFRDLLQNWFPQCRLYGQRIVAASAIHPLRGVAAQARCISPSSHGDQGLAALPMPASFLAVCSRVEAPASPGELESVFVDPRDDLHERFSSLRPVFAASPGIARAGGEAVEYLPVDRGDAVASPALVSGDGTLVSDLLGAIFGHDDAVPLDRAEAVAQARKLVRDVFEERDRATVRLAELEAEVADQYARIAEAEARDDRSAGAVGALRAESERLRAKIESLRSEVEAQRLETTNATGTAERLVAQLETAARQREALLAELERLRNHVDGRASGVSAEPARSALAGEVLQRQWIDQFAERNGEGAAVPGVMDRPPVFGAPRPEENARLANALRERDEARVQLDRLLASRSWRMTEPLRQLLRPFRDG